MDHHSPRGHDHGRSWLRSLVAHTHDHGDRVDRAIESSQAGIVAVKRSLVGLGITAALQAGVVAISGSVALLGDTLHNLADALTALPLWAAFRFGRRPADQRYTYGYGRAEDVAGVAIVVVIALTAVVAGYEAVTGLFDPGQVRNVGAVAGAGVIGFAGNEAVARYRIRVGRSIGSAALVADGLHARTDGVTSLGVLVGAAGVAAGFPLADPLVGVAITVAIVLVLRGAARDVYHRLMDAVDTDLVPSATGLVTGVDGVHGVSDVRVRWIGHQLHASVRILVDEDLDVAAGHDIAERVRHTLLHGLPRLSDALVHVDPCGHGGRDHHAALGHHRPAP
ncbi:MAG: cation diffusion facilitator family transporter [Acidimicrobiales bacterium]